MIEAARLLLGLEGADQRCLGLGCAGDSKFDGRARPVHEADLAVECSSAVDHVLRRTCLFGTDRECRTGVEPAHIEAASGGVVPYVANLGPCRSDTLRASAEPEQPAMSNVPTPTPSAETASEMLLTSPVWTSSLEMRDTFLAPRTAVRHGGQRRRDRAICAGRLLPMGTISHAFGRDMAGIRRLRDRDAGVPRAGVLSGFRNAERLGQTRRSLGIDLPGCAPSGPRDDLSRAQLGWLARATDVSPCFRDRDRRAGARYRLSAVEPCSLGRFHQGVVTIHDEHEVIEHGPYRWVRHPMYASSAIALLGVGLALGTYPGLVITSLGTLPAMLRRINVEERALESALGQRYTSFASTRRRLIPGIW